MSRIDSIDSSLFLRAKSSRIFAPGYFLSATSMFTKLHTYAARDRRNVWDFWNPRLMPPRHCGHPAVRVGMRSLPPFPKEARGIPRSTSPKGWKAVAPAADWVNEIFLFAASFSEIAEKTTVPGLFAADHWLEYGRQRHVTAYFTYAYLLCALGSRRSGVLFMRRRCTSRSNHSPSSMVS